MSPLEFYALLGSPFGYSAGYGPNFHAGQDYPWGNGTAIPAPAAGRVVAKGYTSEAGYYVVLLIGGRYFLFYHMRSSTPLALGADIAYGQTAGYVGSTGNSTGNHLHLAVSSSKIPGLGVRIDPVVVISGLLKTALAAGLGVEFDNTPTVKVRYDVTTLYAKQGSDPMLYALAGDSPGTSANWLETTGYESLAVPWARAHGNAIVLSPSTFDSFKARYLPPVTVLADSVETGSVVVAPDLELLAAVKDVVAAVNRLNPPG